MTIRPAKIAGWFSLLLTICVAAMTARGADWKLVWHDEFDKNGPPDPANWDFERGFVRNHELQWYQPENAFCTNGLLVIEARPEHKPNPFYQPGGTSWASQREWIEYTSASLVTRHKQELKYGKFEMRARIDTRLGSWPAFWTLGTDIQDTGWPACGEIDIMEYYTGHVLANVCYRLNSAANGPPSKIRSPGWAVTNGRNNSTSGRWNGTRPTWICCSTGN